VKEQLEKVKNHFRENKGTYIACGITAAISGGSAYLAASAKVSQKAIVIGKDNQVHLEQITVLARRGHPGFIIKCNETGELFASISRAAEMMNLSRPNLTKHLQGKHDNVGGFTFSNLGEAQ
jgi:hypothetical protein